MVTGQRAANTGIEIIDRDECLSLLQAEEVGRLAVLDGGRPLIVPVNYVLDGEDVVFRTAPGTKLDQGPRSPVCFEIDGFDRPHHAGWSVVVSGRLDEVTHYDAKRFARASHLPVHPWADGAKDHVMRLVPSMISGRRIRGDG
jgi:nitroimidazol reductase NimA-like FMN-containing flavoprotein (pyridoxamine 5'-phosphate oxidase superfamily)